MIHAYDKNYLPSAQKNMARMLDYMVNDLGYPLETAWQFFLASDLSSRFEQGDFSVLSGMSGVELARTVIRQSGKAVPDTVPTYSYDRSPEYWTGWALAYYQWDTSLHFTDITRTVPIYEIRRLYHPFHEMDIRQFADRMNELYLAKTPNTNLKNLRNLAGFSQSELAVLSEVPVRSIQQYEQRQKNINKAQAETLLRLARALNCRMEDLIEKVPYLHSS